MLDLFHYYSLTLYHSSFIIYYSLTEVSGKAVSVPCCRCCFHTSSEVLAAELTVVAGDYQGSASGAGR